MFSHFDYRLTPQIQLNLSLLRYFLSKLFYLLIKIKNKKKIYEQEIARNSVANYFYKLLLLLLL